MRKILALVDLDRVYDYQASGVDAVLMGTKFSATRQLKTYQIAEMAKVNQDIEVIAVFNRFYFEPELDQVLTEMREMRQAGIQSLICTDLAVVQLNKRHQLGFKVTLDTDTTMTNAYDIKIMQEHGVDEVVVGRELTLDERMELAKDCEHLGMHFFGYQLMSFSRRHHLKSYNEFRGLDLDLTESYWIREAKRDEDYLIFEDAYGTHIYAPGIFSAIHAYPLLKESKAYDALYFEVLELDIDLLLALCKVLDEIDNYEQYEKELTEKYGLLLNYGLLYTSTQQGAKHA